MKTIQEAVINLLKIKSIVTVLTTLVFCYQAITNTISQEFLMVYTVIIAFYFGTQYKKNEENNKEYLVVDEEMTDEEIASKIL